MPEQNVSFCPGCPKAGFAKANLIGLVSVGTEIYHTTGDTEELMFVAAQDEAGRLSKLVKTPINVTTAEFLNAVDSCSMPEIRKIGMFRHKKAICPAMGLLACEDATLEVK